LDDENRRSSNIDLAGKDHLHTSIYRVKQAQSPVTIHPFAKKELAALVELVYCLEASLLVCLEIFLETSRFISHKCKNMGDRWFRGIE